MKKGYKVFLTLCSIFIISLGLLFFLYRLNLNQFNEGVFKGMPMVEATASDNVYGWAWGPNFGWIGLNCLNDYDGDGKITLSSPDENHCSSGAYGVNIGVTGEFDDDSYAWSDHTGWMDFAPASTQAIDPEGGATQDCTLNTDGTISGWVRSVAAHWPNPACYDWVKMRGDIMPNADFDTYTWNAGTSTFQGTFPTCHGCDYYDQFCVGGDNNGNTCTSDGDCTDGTCEYKTVESTANSAEYLCDICYSDVMASNVGSERLCVKTDNDNRCSGCTDNEPGLDTCTDCPRCYEYGVAVDYSKNRLSGWAWGMLHKEVGTGSCAGSVGVGWLAFHTLNQGVFAPWLQSSSGSIYSASGVGSSGTFRPPSGKYNATYAIHSGGTITNFYSTSGSYWEDEYYDVIEYPGADTNYTNVLGRIDFAGLQAGLYGETEAITSQADIDSILGGKVYIRDGSLTISSALTFDNGSSGTPDGRGTIIVNGDLNINANVAYSAAAVNKIKYLPSVAFIVKGDVNVDPAVSSLDGAYIVLGDGDPVDCPALSSASNGCGRFSTGLSYTSSLELNGLVMAKQFNLERLYSSLTEGAEQFIYDGRLLANTPPGMEDLTQALPEWVEVAP